MSKFPYQDVRVHAVSFLITRACLYPDLLRRQNLSPWFRSWSEALSKRRSDLRKAESRHAGSEDLKYLSMALEQVPEVFIPGVGPVLSKHPGRQLPQAFGLKYQHSEIEAVPWYIPVNWRISLVNELLDAKVFLTLRVRLFEHGGCTIALLGQVRSEDGVPIGALADMLRNLTSDISVAKSQLRVRTATETFVASVPETLHRLVDAVGKSIFGGRSNLEDAIGATVKPDFTVIDLGRCSPDICLPDSDELLARLLMLDMTPVRRIVHKKNPDLAWNETDWAGISSKRLLFCDTNRPWPSEGRLQRMCRHRARVLWTLFSAVEVARQQKLLTTFVANSFEASSLAMIRANNQSLDFLRNLLKSSYYDDHLATLAMDLPNTRGQLGGRDASLYDAMGAAIHLEDEQKRMQAASQQFLSNISAWVPGAKKLLDLVKLIPMK